MSNTKEPQFNLLSILSAIIGEKKEGMAPPSKAWDAAAFYNAGAELLRLSQEFENYKTPEKQAEPQNTSKQKGFFFTLSKFSTN